MQPHPHRHRTNLNDNVLSSLGSFGRRRTFNSSSYCSTFFFASDNSSFRSSRISSSCSSSSISTLSSIVCFCFFIFFIFFYDRSQTHFALHQIAESILVANYICFTKFLHNLIETFYKILLIYQTSLFLLFSCAFITITFIHNHSKFIAVPSYTLITIYVPDLHFL